MGRKGAVYKKSRPGFGVDIGLVCQKVLANATRDSPEHSFLG